MDKHPDMTGMDEDPTVAGGMPRRIVLAGGLAAGAAAVAQAQALTVQTEALPRTLNGHPVPEPPPDKSA
jgi:hypothetical protein